MIELTVRLTEEQLTQIAERTARAAARALTGRCRA
jgi:hypothetical protein